MHFLNASWLWPLLPLVAIPPLIHWLSNRYPKKFAFSSIDEIRKQQGPLPGVPPAAGPEAPWWRRIWPQPGW